MKKTITEQELRKVVRKELQDQLQEGPMDYLKAIGRLGQKVGTSAVKIAAQKIVTTGTKIQQSFATELAKSQDETFKNNFPTDLETLYAATSKSVVSLINKYKGAISRITDKDVVKLEV